MVLEKIPALSFFPHITFYIDVERTIAVGEHHRGKAMVG